MTETTSETPTPPKKSTGAIRAEMKRVRGEMRHLEDEWGHLQRELDQEQWIRNEMERVRGEWGQLQRELEELQEELRKKRETERKPLDFAIPFLYCAGEVSKTNLRAAWILFNHLSDEEGDGGD